MKTATATTAPRGSESFWGKARSKLWHDRLGMAAAAVVLGYFIIALGVWLHFWGQGWGTFGNIKQTAGPVDKYAVLGYSRSTNGHAFVLSNV